MGRITSILTAACAATVLTTNVVAAQGTLSDRKTNVTFSGPVSLPGTTLPAGTYVFKIADSPANRHIVQIFDRDEQKIITTLLAVPASRNEAEGEAVVAFKETPSNRAPAVRYWYYAGEKDGNEFIYPRAQAMMIAQASGESVSAFDSDATDMESWKKGGVTTVSPADAQSASSATGTASASGTTGAMTSPAATTGTTASATPQSTTPAASTTPSTEPTSAPATTGATTGQPSVSSTAAPATTPEQSDRPVGTSGRSNSLPRTASQLPLIGVIGLFALAGAFGVRAIRRSIV